MRIMDKKDQHISHRQRMYDRYAQAGIDGFAPHEVLELMLYYAIPRKDVNPLAHDLIDSFGSFAGVLDAHVDDLAQIGGMSSRTAVYLGMYPKIMRLYNTQKAMTKDALSSVAKVAEYLHDLYIGHNKEAFYLLCLDAKCRLIQAVQINTGEVGGINIHPKNIVESAIRYNSSQVIFSHNHPYGQVEPSQEDTLFTRRLAVVMHTIDIPVIDHMIVNELESYSFARDGKMEQINKEVNIRIATKLTEYST